MKLAVLLFILCPVCLLAQTSNPNGAVYDSVKGVSIELHNATLDTNSKDSQNDKIAKSLQLLQSQILSQSTENEKHEKIVKNLTNGNGTIIEYGTAIRGYSSNHFDTSQYGKITVLEEYKNNKVNGRRIQFFYYPNDTASVEFYKDNVLNGPFYYKHRNGQIWEKGTYKNGEKSSQSKCWTEEGDEILNNKNYSEKNGLFYVNGKHCNGKHLLFGHGGLEDGKVINKIYFRKGKIDSLYSFSWAYWGKISEIRCNYIDSTRKYIYYQSLGKTKWIYSQKIISSSNTFYKEGDFWYIKTKEKLIQDGKFTTYHKNSDIISDEGFYKNDFKTGQWKFYDEKGVLIRTENY